MISATCLSSWPSAANITRTRCSTTARSCAAGVLNSLTKDYVSENQIVIDVSINWDPEKVNSKGGKGAIAGDAVFSEVEPIVGAITPVPGGVGSVTTSVLIGHVVEAAERTL